MRPSLRVSPLRRFSSIQDEEIHAKRHANFSHYLLNRQNLIAKLAQGQVKPVVVVYDAKVLKSFEDLGEARDFIGM